MIPQYADRVPCGDCEDGMFIYGAMHACHAVGVQCIGWHHLLNTVCQYNNKCLDELPNTAKVEKVVKAIPFQEKIQ